MLVGTMHWAVWPLGFPNMSSETFLDLTGGELRAAVARSLRKLAPVLMVGHDLTCSHCLRSFGSR